MTAELLLLADWLQVAGCTHVAMESTGVYWRPVYNLLANLANISFTPVRNAADCIRWSPSCRPVGARRKR